MTVGMSDTKQTADSDTTPYVITAIQPAAEKPKSRLTKKHVLIAVTCLAITVIVMACVLAAIRIYTDSNMDILKYQMTMKDKDNNNVTQDVSADANANIVQYHVVKDGVEAWILHDFDKGIQVSKVLTDSSVGCYVTSLNKSLATDPRAIPSKTPKTDSKTPSIQLVYKVSKDPIDDISFLGRRPNALCKNIPTYWMEPSCETGSEPSAPNTTASGVGDRRKRAAICATCGGYYCACGCCGLVCGSFASDTYQYYYSNGYWVCVYYMYYVSCNYSLRPYPCNFNGRSWYLP